MKTENKNTLTELYNSTRYLSNYINLNDVLNYNDINTLKDFYNVIFERINEIEIIYFFNAINILKEEDQSLTECLNLAQELSYTPENLNSEILATLLIQERCINELNDLYQEIEENKIFNH